MAKHDEVDPIANNPQGFVAVVFSKEKQLYRIGTRIEGLILDAEEIASLGKRLNRTYPEKHGKRWVIRIKNNTLYIWVRVPYRKLSKAQMFRHACTFRAILKENNIMERAMVCLVFG